MNLVNILRMSKDEARTYLEQIRWPNGPVCPRCEGKNVVKLEGKSTRPGVYKCRDCRKRHFSPQFTVTVGTIFEDSHIPLNKWIAAFFMVCSSKKGVSAHQIHRTLGITYKTTWFMAHRIRQVMKHSPALKDKLTGVVEADETYIGGKTDRKHKNKNKIPVLALVQRDGNVRTKTIERVTSKNLRQNLQKHVDPQAILMTDQWKGYQRAGKRFKEHYTVNHSIREYVRGEAHVNTAESFFALLKRGVYGSFHHVAGKHLFRYCDEFSFRWNNREKNDGEMVAVALKKAEGKRLTYQNRLKKFLS